jgi:hypothetical protein
VPIIFDKKWLKLRMPKVAEIKENNNNSVDDFRCLDQQ